ncbi:MAG: O-antigen ligase family protein [bacterium]
MRFFLLCLFFFVLPVAFWPGSTSYEASKLTALALVGAFLLFAASYRWSRRHELILRPSWLLDAGLALLLIGSCGLFLAVNRWLVLEGIFCLALWLWIAGSTSEAIRSRAGLFGLTRALVLGGVVAAGYGLLQLAEILPGAPHRFGLPVAISSLGNQNYLAGLLTVVFFPSLLLWQTDRIWKRLLAVAATLVLLVTVCLCRSIGPLLGLVAAAIPLLGGWILLRRHRSHLVPRWYLICLVASLGLAATGLGLAFTAARDVNPDGSVNPNPFRRLYNRNSGDQRRADWYVCWSMLREQPLTGVGLNHYQVAWPEHRERMVSSFPEADWIPPTPRTTLAHNDYLQLAAECGAPGLLWVLVVGIGGLIHWRRRFLRLRDPRQQRDYLLLLAGLNCAAVHGLVSFPAHLPATAAALALCFGGLSSRRFDLDAPRRIRLPWHPAFALLTATVGLVLAGGALREFRADLTQRVAMDHYLLGQYEPARHRFEDAISNRLWPGSGLTYLALCQVATGDPASGESTLRRALDTEPTYEALLQLAELLRDQQRFAEAHVLVDRLIACKPIHHFGRDGPYTRATILLREGRYPEARSELDGVLADDPDHHRAWIAYGFLESLAGNNGRARAHYRQALTIIDGKLLGITTPEVRASVGEGPRAALSLTGREERLRRHRIAAERALAGLEQ